MAWYQLFVHVQMSRLFLENVQYISDTLSPHRDIQISKTGAFMNSQYQAVSLLHAMAWL